jgi:hypothetical protein
MIERYVNEDEGERSDPKDLRHITKVGGGEPRPFAPERFPGPTRGPSRTFPDRKPR